MSKVTAVYSGIIAKMIDVYAGKTRIPYPYSLKDNIDKFLFDGWGIKVQAQGQSSFVESCSFAVNRTMSIVITREYISTESDTSIQDDVALLLLEDVYSIQKMFFNPDKMGIGEILLVEDGGVTGVEEVLVGKKKFLSMEVSFQININEVY